jgi:hypothetical protein
MSPEISRRAFVGHVLGAAGAGALSGSVLGACVSNAQNPTDPMKTAIGPKTSGAKLRGANLVGGFNQVSGDTVWAALWRVWDWDNWIRPQLDDIAKVSNAVRFWGNTLVVADGSLTLTQYLTRWRQVLDYIQSLGLYVYPCGGDLGHWGDYTWAQSTQTYSELAQLLASYSNVIGVDIVNEARSLGHDPDNFSYQQPEPVEKLLVELGGIVRAAGLPITYSRSIRDKSGWSLDYFTDHMGDFLDFHVYYSPGPNDSLIASQQPWGVDKRLIIGEFGQDLTVASAQRTAYYDAIRTMCANDPNCLGAFAWSAWDLGTTATSQWGLYDAGRVLRQDIGEPFAKFPA